jgi:hypothetical protein
MSLHASQSLWALLNAVFAIPWPEHCPPAFAALAPLPEHVPPAEAALNAAPCAAQLEFDAALAPCAAQLEFDAALNAAPLPEQVPLEAEALFAPEQWSYALLVEAVTALFALPAHVAVFAEAVTAVVSVPGQIAASTSGASAA